MPDEPHFHDLFKITTITSKKVRVKDIFKRKYRQGVISEDTIERLVIEKYVNPAIEIFKKHEIYSHVDLIANKEKIAPILEELNSKFENELNNL